MRNAIWLVFTLACAAQAAAPNHEAAEDKARTVPGAASMGVKACHDDIERWCRNVKPGEGRLGACLEKHVKQLSPQCRRWAEHGGKSHRAEAFRELDKPVTAPPSTPPAPSPATR